MLSRWFDHVSHCVAMPIATPACRSFWEYAMYVSAAFGVMLVAWIIWKRIGYRMKYTAALRAQSEQSSPINATPLREPSWSEAENITADITDPHLAGKIRHELEQRRLQNLRG